MIKAILRKAYDTAVSVAAWNMLLNRQLRRAGDRLDIFTVKHSSPDELTLFIEDAHLDVFVSLIRADHGADKAVYMATTVNTHNLLGKVYMLFGGPFHRVLVKHQLARAGLRDFK